MRQRRREKKEQPSHADDWLMTYADMITLLLCFFAIFLIVSIAKKDKLHKETLRPATVVVAAAPTPMPKPNSVLPSDVFRNDAPFRTIEPSDFPPSAKAPEIPAPVVVAPPPVVVPVAVAAPPIDDAGAAKLPTPAAEAPPPVVEAPKPQADAPTEPKGDRITAFEMNSAAFFDSGSSTLSAPGKGILQDVAGRLKSGQYKDYLITVEGHTDDSPIATSQFPSNWELSTARASAVVHFFLEQGVPAARLRAAGYADSFPKAPNRDAAGNPIPANQAQNRRVVIRLERIEKAGAAEQHGIEP